MLWWNFPCLRTNVVFDSRTPLVLELWTKFERVNEVVNRCRTTNTRYELCKRLDRCFKFFTNQSTSRFECTVKVCLTFFFLRELWLRWLDGCDGVATFS